MRVRLPHLVLAAVAAGSLLGAASASAGVTQLGPRPASGGSWGVEFSASPTVLRKGDLQTLNPTLTSGTYWLGSSYNNWVWRSAVTNPGPGVTWDGPSCSTLYFAGSTSCRVKATAATGGWRTHGLTFTLNNGNSATYVVPYAVLPDDTYDIGGTLTLRNRDASAGAVDTPAVGMNIKVEQIGGDGETYTTTSAAQGQYDVQVGKGTWRVRPLDRGFCKAPLGAGGCQKTVTVTTGGDQTVDFVQPGPVTATGSVKTKDGTPVTGAKVRARQTDDGDTTTYEAVSDKDGNYAIEGLLPNVPITFDSPVPYICPITPGEDPAIGSNSECVVPKRTVDGTGAASITQDFQKPGCFTNIDFETSMQARGRCFKLSAPETWETDEAFRLDGIDFTPKDGQTVTFDKRAKTVDFGTGSFAVSLEHSGVSRVLPPLANLGVVRFEAATAKFFWAAGLTVPKVKQFGGWPIAGQITATLSSGSSELSFKLKAPKDPKNQYQFIFNDFGEDADSFAVEAKITADMDRGARGLEGTVEDAIDTKIVALKSVSVGYDWPDGAWTLKGTVEPKFATKAGATVAAAPGVAAKQFSGSLTATGLPFYNGGEFRKFSVSADGLNRHISDGFFLQRVGLGIDFGGFTPNTRGKTALSAGFSFGPQLASAKTVTIPQIPGISRQHIEVTVIPKEAVSLDGEGSLEWSSTADGASGDDKKLSLTAAMKLWDQPIGTANFALWPNIGLGTIGLDHVGITDPTGGSLLSLQGKAEGWIDLRHEGSFFVNGRGQASIGTKGTQAEFFLSGPNPTVVAFCGNVLGTSIGGALNFDDILATPPVAEGATCDLAPFRAAKPQLPDTVGAPTAPPFTSGADQNTGTGSKAKRSGARRAKASKVQTFTATGNEGTIPVQLTTGSTDPGFPDLKITGPGLSATVKNGVVSGGKRVGGFVFAAQRRAVLVFDRPRKGKYTIAVTSKGGAPLAAPAFSKVLADPQVQTGLDRSQCGPTIHWSATGISGQTLRFTEEHPDGTRQVLGTSTAKSGKLTVTPPAGERGSSELFVEVVNGSTVRLRQSVGRYTSTVGATVPGPTNVAVKDTKAKGKGKQSTVSWTGVCGATGYQVVVTTGKQSSAPITVKGATATTIPRPKKGARVTVTSLGSDGAPAGSTLVTVG